ncbi:helix-turn-helix domain-containing protein [Nocardia abscessus]|uniref:helix-turn-helix domain-containing protein n=2 Tax=Nocardia abscessus TaxID=120957 RepID=UPI0002D30B84|nr:helix-turn-helix domain-containing protein [Nocardia abscessus]MCC3333190.1 helix-turn-helix domain-containing protein [Nocardia abscessus]
MPGSAESSSGEPPHARNPQAPTDTKGILHPDEQAKHRSLVRLPPGRAVDRYVEWYWAVRWDLRGRPPYRAEVLSYPSVNVTFERSGARTGGFVNGVTTTKFIRELSGLGETFGIRFRAGGFGAFTGLDVGSLRDRAVPIADVLPDAAGLTERVLDAPTVEQRRGVVEEYLADRPAAADPTYRLVLRIVEAMATDQELTRVDQIAERFDVPARTLQRMFRRYVGAGPKWVLRRYRLQDGADLLAKGRIDDLAALAAELGYFDQAHFSREFTAEVGMAPLEYAKNSLHFRNEVTAKVMPTQG